MIKEIELEGVSLTIEELVGRMEEETGLILCSRGRGTVVNGHVTMIRDFVENVTKVQITLYEEDEDPIYVEDKKGSRMQDEKGYDIVSNHTTLFRKHHLASEIFEGKLKKVLLDGGVKVRKGSDKM